MSRDCLEPLFFFLDIQKLCSSELIFISLNNETKIAYFLNNGRPKIKVLLRENL